MGKLAFLFSITLSIQLVGQTVSNVEAVVDGDKVDIRYNLGGDSTRNYLVKLFYSTDEKDFTKSPKFITGAVGRDQKVGRGKQITWEIKKELVDFNGSIRFKVETIPLASILVKDTSQKMKNFENGDFKVEYVSTLKVHGGFRIKALIQAKVPIKSSFRSNSYTIDNLNRSYPLKAAVISGKDLMTEKYNFFEGASETIELLFLGLSEFPDADEIRGFSLDYGKGVILVNL